MPLAAAAPALTAVGAATSAGLGIAGALGAFDPDMPEGPNYGAMSRDAQKATIDLLPDKYNAQATYNPRFAALQRQLSYENLFGTPASSREEQYIDYEPVEQRVPTGRGTYSRSNEFIPEYQTVTIYQPVPKTRTVSTEASRGMLDIAREAAPQLNALSNESRRMAIESDLGTLEQFSPRAAGVIRGYDPATTSLFDTLAAQAQDELAAGRGLTASEQREAEQQVRGAQASRGLGYGPTDVFTEALTLGQRGTNRLRERQQLASQVAGQRASWMGDPFVSLLQRTSGRSTDPAGYVQATQPQMPDLTAIPGAAYDFGLAGYGAQQNAARAGYNAQVGSIGALAGGIGGLGRAFANWPGAGAPAGTVSTPTSSYAPGNYFGGYGY